MPEVVRLNVNLNRETAEELHRIAATHGLTITEVIRRAVSVYGFIHDETQAGHTVSTGKGRKRREVVLL